MERILSILVIVLMGYVLLSVEAKGQAKSASRKHAGIGWFAPGVQVKAVEQVKSSKGAFSNMKPRATPIGEKPPQPPNKSPKIPHHEPEIGEWKPPVAGYSKLIANKAPASAKESMNAVPPPPVLPMVTTTPRFTQPPAPKPQNVALESAKVAPQPKIALPKPSQKKAPTRRKAKPTSLNPLTNPKLPEGFLLKPNKKAILSKPEGKTVTSTQSSVSIPVPKSSPASSPTPFDDLQGLGTDPNLLGDPFADSNAQMDLGSHPFSQQSRPESAKQLVEIEATPAKPIPNQPQVATSPLQNVHRSPSSVPLFDPLCSCSCAHQNVVSNNSTLFRDSQCKHTQWDIRGLTTASSCAKLNGRGLCEKSYQRTGSECRKSTAMGTLGSCVFKVRSLESLGD